MTRITQETIWLNDIEGSLERTKKYLPDHYNTLWGERSAGSKWGFELTPDHISGDWKLVQGGTIYNNKPRYFVIGYWRKRGPVRIYEKESEHEFTLGVQPLSMTEIGDIRIEDGSHGPELVMNVGSIPAEDLPKTNIMTLIIGPEEDCGDVVFTIHPGEATPPHGCKTVEELHMKLNNGGLDPKTSVKFV